MQKDSPKLAKVKEIDCKLWRNGNTNEDVFGVAVFRETIRKAAFISWGSVTQSHVEVGGTKTHCCTKQVHYWLAQCENDCRLIILQTVSY